MDRESVQLTPAHMSALVETAVRWQDVDYARRVEAEEATLAIVNRFTAQALAFAVNQQMSLLTEVSLLSWIPQVLRDSLPRVALLMSGNIPFVGLQDLIGTVLTGGSCTVVVSSRSPALVPAFVDDWRECSPDLPVSFSNLDTALSRCDSIIASGTDRTMDSLVSRLVEAGIAPERALLRGHRYSVAILDPKWNRDDYAHLAEDIWLHEGMGCRSVALLFAPASLTPDPLLNASAEFRAVFPPHASSRGALELQRAFLSAVDQPHAHGEELEFLISRGEAEPQGPGHLRWTPYDDLSEVLSWLETNRSEIQLVVAKPESAFRIPDGMQTVRPGYAQRPELGWPQDGVNLLDFLASL